MLSRSFLVWIVIGIVGPIYAGCGETSRPASESTSGGSAIELDEEHSADERTLLELRDSPEFQAASARMDACLQAAGFTRDGDAMILKDGTRFGPDQLTEGGLETTYALIEFFAANERCEQESGLAALRREAGVANEPLDPKFLQRANAAAIAVTACLEDRGWTFEPPISHRGVVHYFPKLEASEQDAYDLDAAECRTETTGP